MRIATLVAWCLLVLLTAAPASPAEPAAAGTSVEATPPAPAAGQPTPHFPYTGKVTADVVNVRCGPGLYYYPLATVKRDTPVVVEGEKNGWLAIRPPEEAFGLMRKSNLDIGPEGTQGTVISPSARVYISSSSAGRQWCVATILKQDDRVTVMGPAEGDFVKVQLPARARAYIVSNYVTAATATPPTQGGTPTPPGEVQPLESDPLIAAYKKAEADLKAELRKDLDARNYEPIATAFQEVAEKAEKAYVKNAAKRQLAYVEQLIQEQAEYRRVLSLPQRLEENLSEIKNRWTQQQAESAAEKRMGGPEFVATGCVRQLASLEGVDYPIKYKLVDQNDKPLVLLKSSQYNLADYIGKIVGVRGSKEYIPEWRIYCITVDDLEVLEE